MNEFTIYHNPRCTKSRDTLGLLHERGVEPRVIEYLKEPPTKSELQALVAKLDLIERPIVVSGQRAVIGRPPQNVLQLLK